MAMLTPAEYREKYKLSKGTVYKLIREKKVKAVRLGERRLFIVDDLEELANAE